MTGKSGASQGAGDGDSYYSLDKDKKKKTILRRLIAFNNLIISQAMEVAERSKQIDTQFKEIVDHYNNFTAKSKPLQNDVLRIMLSLQEGESLTEEQWQDMILDFGKELGYDFDRHQYTLYLHNDTKYQHIHFQINRADIDTSYIISDSHIGRKTEKICEKLTLKYNLKVNPSKVNTVNDAKRAKNRPESNDYIRNVLNSLLNGGGLLAASKKRNNRMDLLFLQEELLKYEIGIKLKFDSAKKLVGCSFTHDGEAYSGQKVGWKAGEMLKKINSLDSKNKFEKKDFFKTLNSIFFELNTKYSMKENIFDKDFSESSDRLLFDSNLKVGSQKRIDFTKALFLSKGIKMNHFEKYSYQDLKEYLKLNDQYLKEFKNINDLSSGDKIVDVIDFLQDENKEERSSTNEELRSIDILNKLNDFNEKFKDIEFEFQGNAYPLADVLECYDNYKGRFESKRVDFESKRVDFENNTLNVNETKESLEQGFEASYFDENIQQNKEVKLEESGMGKQKIYTDEQAERDKRRKEVVQRKGRGR